MDSPVFIIGFLLFTGCCTWFSYRAGWLEGVSLTGAIYKLAVAETISYLIAEKKLDSDWSLRGKGIADEVARHASSITLCDPDTENDDA
jgi:hypothetical protein